MKIIEDQHARLSTVIARHLPVSNWYDMIGEETIANTIIDRLVHISHRIELEGERYQKTAILKHQNVF
jgi:DNA replication protein DnaC